MEPFIFKTNRHQRRDAIQAVAALVPIDEPKRQETQPRTPQANGGVIMVTSSPVGASETIGVIETGAVPKVVVKKVPFDWKSMDNIKRQPRKEEENVVSPPAQQTLPQAQQQHPEPTGCCEKLRAKQVGCYLALVATVVAVIIVIYLLAR